MDCIPNRRAKKVAEETATARWIAEGIDKDEEIFDTFKMTDECLSALASHGGSLLGRDQLVDFLLPWYGMNEYADDLLICLQKKWPALNDDDAQYELPSKAQQKAVLKDVHASKKIKQFDDPVAAKEAKISMKRDQWAFGITRRWRRRPQRPRVQNVQSLPANDQRKFEKGMASEYVLWGHPTNHEPRPCPLDAICCS